uniref:Stearoyl-CoA desaturase (Delta-9 desaturase) n=1 Tax=Tetraselmis sp. GSL018 TaxID=582737 RepID=A0A061R7R8_9CHLO
MASIARTPVCSSSSAFSRRLSTKPNGCRTVRKSLSLVSPLPSRQYSNRSQQILPSSLRAATVDDTEQLISKPVVDEISYSKQYDDVMSRPLVTSKPIEKPSKDAQAQEPNSTKVFASDVHAVGKRNLWLNRKWDSTDRTYAIFLGAMHLLCLAAPFTFSWEMVALFAVGYFITGCLGITLSYHRQLSHRSFRTPKWLEYALAYCGVLSVQGDPIEWVSTHRYHHLHTDTPLDPHSPYEGLWWSHAGWLLDHEAVEKRVSDRSNASDLEKQWFYRFIAKTYNWHVVGSFALLFLLGGFPALVWGGAVRAVWVYHITWFVNSATHVWGNQQYDTGDLSRNNWWVGILAFGEGWHNNHHAFEFSARHGLEWYQFDMTWIIINVLKFFGLADRIKLPTEAQKRRLAFK